MTTGYANQRRKEPEELRAKLTRSEIEFMIMSHIRHRELFDEAKNLIKPDYLDVITEKDLRLVWASALAIAELHEGALPKDAPAQVLYVECQARIQRAGDGAFTEQEYNDLFAEPAGLLAWYFSRPLEEMNATHARVLRRDFIIQRTYGQLNRLLYTVVEHGHTPGTKDKVDRILDQLSGTNNVEGLNIRGAFDESLLSEPPADDPIPWPTGLKFIDVCMNGGQCGGEAYTLMGPTGVGKTSLAMQMAVSSRREQVRMATDLQGHVAGSSIFFTWETDFNKSLLKAWSCGAVIKLSPNELPKFSELLAVLSGRREDGTYVKLKDYEQELFAQEIAAAGGAEKYGGELGRLRKVMRDLGPNGLLIYDMTDVTKYGGKWGVNGLDDILRTLRQLESNGVKIGVVYIDYAGLMIDQFMAERGIDTSQTRHYLKKLGIDCVRRIAIPYKCPVWILHQVNTASNKGDPTRIISHADGEESGQIAQNATFSFQLGTKVKEYNVCQLFCTKTRRGPPVDQYPILHIDGAFSRLLDASDRYMVDRSQGRIVPREMQQVFAGDEEQVALPPLRQQRRASQLPSRGSYA